MIGRLCVKLCVRAHRHCCVSLQQATANTMDKINNNSVSTRQQHSTTQQTNTTEAVKKVKKAKKEPKRAAGKKKQQKEAESACSLMTELPFASTEVWKELG
ncbi:hypothetical protein cypCar_00013359, partial [Cyprinus carpio]